MAARSTQIVYLPVYFKNLLRMFIGAKHAHLPVLTHGSFIRIFPDHPSALGVSRYPVRIGVRSYETIDERPFTRK
jgi:hypothetical protein